MNRRSFLKSALPLASILAYSPLNKPFAQSKSRENVDQVELTGLRLNEWSQGYVPRKIDLIGFGRSGKRIIKSFGNKYRYGLSDIEYATEIDDNHIEDIVSFEPEELISRTLSSKYTKSEFEFACLSKTPDIPDSMILIGNSASIEEIELLIRTAEMAHKQNIFTIGVISLSVDQHRSWKSTEEQILLTFEQSLDSLILVPDIGHYQTGNTMIQQVAENLIRWCLASRHRYFNSFDLSDIQNVLKLGRGSYFYYDIQENSHSLKDNSNRIVCDHGDFKGGLIHFRYNNYHNKRKLSVEKIFSQIEQVVPVIDSKGNWFFDQGDWLFCFTEDRDCQELNSISIILVG